MNDNVKLTPREEEVVFHLASGLTMKKTAERLGISPKTVDAHKTNLMKRLDIHNRVDLVKWAVRTGLVKA